MLKKNGTILIDAMVFLFVLSILVTLTTSTIKASLQTKETITTLKEEYEFNYEEAIHAIPTITKEERIHTP